MTAIVTGAGGQLGRALQALVPAGVELLAPARAELDITDAAAVDVFFERHRPGMVINAAAHTAVDQAESESDMAALVNAAAVGHLAKSAAAIGAALVQVSTDFVFSGAASRPYAPTAATGPCNVYGATKLQGEQAALAAGGLVIRTAWVHGRHGSNFVKTMLRLMRERESLKVVSDQIGTPTSATHLAGAVWQLAGREKAGVLHFTDSGEASWFDFAVAIQEEALAVGLLDKAIAIIPITTEDYPTPARRPRYSVLDCSETYALLGQPAPHWREGLRATLEDIKAHG